MGQKKEKSTFCFDRLYWKHLQDIVIDKKEYIPLCEVFSKHVNGNNGVSDRLFRKHNYYSFLEFALEIQT